MLVLPTFNLMYHISNKEVVHEMVYKYDITSIFIFEYSIFLIRNAKYWLKSTIFIINKYDRLDACWLQPNFESNIKKLL